MGGLFAPMHAYEKIAEKVPETEGDGGWHRNSDKKFIFTFLRHQGVPPTNNHAEQSIRHLVIFRKICFGTRSEKGLKTHSIIPSLIQTARRQGVDPRNFLQTLLTSDTTTSQAALYKNSS
jgi:hypothetical protein